MEIVERPETLVSLTPTAAEKIRELMAEDPDGESSVLRVAIQGGGCSGFSTGSASTPARSTTTRRSSCTASRS